MVNSHTGKVQEDGAPTALCWNCTCIATETMGFNQHTLIKVIDGTVLVAASVTASGQEFQNDLNARRFAK